LFTGQIATRATFASDLEFIEFYDFPRDSLVVVSSPKELRKELRFVVANGEIVAGCLYKTGDTLDYQPECDREALEFAKSVVSSVNYEPDPVWVLDVCETADGTHHVLEIGGFSFADLYACNMSDVVRAVSRAAIAAWQPA
jgi:hypothetical protein